MDYRANEIKAGCFVVFSILLLIFFLVIVSGLDLFKSTNIYLARFKYTSGIEAGSLVRYGGFEVGKVKQVRIADDDNSYIEFVLEIDDKVPVKEDSKVFITSIGIMGEYYIEITTGSAQAKLVPPGSLLHCKEVAPLMTLTDSFDRLTDQLSETIEGINQFLGQENKKQFHDILVNLNGMLQDNQQSFNVLMEKMNVVLTDVHNIGRKLDGMLLENQDEISRSFQELESTLSQSRKMIKEFQTTMENVNRMLISQNGNYDEIMKNLNRTTRNLDEFTRLIKERPWSLIRKSPPNEREIK